jgi:hypothetical protein
MCDDGLLRPCPARISRGTFLSRPPRIVHSHHVVFRNRNSLIAHAFSYTRDHRSEITDVSSSSPHPDRRAGTYSRCRACANPGTRRRCSPAGRTLRSPERHNLSKHQQHAENNAAPLGFRVTPGAVMPNGILLAPVPGTIADLIPQTKGLEAALVEGQVVLADPSSKQIVAVITQGSQR